MRIATLVGILSVTSFANASELPHQISKNTMKSFERAYVARREAKDRENARKEYYLNPSYIEGKVIGESTVGNSYSFTLKDEDGTFITLTSRDEVEASQIDSLVDKGDFVKFKVYYNQFPFCNCFYLNRAQIVEVKKNSDK